ALRVQPQPAIGGARRGGEPRGPRPRPHHPARRAVRRRPAPLRADPARSLAGPVVRPTGGRAPGDPGSTLLLKARPPSTRHADPSERQGRPSASARVGGRSAKKPPGAPPPQPKR